MTGNNKAAWTPSRACVSLALALLAAGCSPPERPLVAIGKGSNAEIWALLRTCSDDDPLREVVIGRSEETGETVEPGALEGWSARPSGSVKGETQFSLFTLPKDWRGDVVSATKLASEGDYSVSFAVGPNETVRYKGVVRFTAADVEGLAPGQWWADGKAMSRAEFRTLANDSC
ncbi:hypothetical protein GCM10010277_85790 [Streptomyces longisporoflavus]|uniref:hypothetical protein n=1 Tax=Streptomyces longisporoflavus TaxID=28044 RepID=UPI00167E346A|nr:hypothetical protein [Streptomyces longisporoflavus]GGV72645.1 hypothetical protein GCM10010277_85790 [Streptomyces longisporoflavus]